MRVSAALCRGLIEARLVFVSQYPLKFEFPRLYAAASLKRSLVDVDIPLGKQFPRLYAAASLKHRIEWIAAGSC